MIVKKPSRCIATFAGVSIVVVGTALAAAQSEAQARSNFQLPWPASDSHNITVGNTYGCTSGHQGASAYAIDFNLSYAAVASIAGGNVSSTGYSATLGWYSKIDHGAGIVSTYGHLQSLGPTSGWVRAGQTIATSGNTGSATTGPHLHFWVVKSGAAYLPEPMSGITGFGNYGYSGGACTNLGTSPSWSGTPSRADVTTFYGPNANQGILHEFLSNGSSALTFQSPPWYDSGPGSYTLSQVQGRMATGDFTGDGRRDIATLYGSGSSAAIHIWKSTGTGFQFQTGMTWSSSSYSLSQVGDRFVAGDFNGDGFDDLAIFYQYNPSAQIHVITSSGTSLSWAGAWATASNYTLAQVAGRMVAGDFNGDKRDDIAAFYDYGSSQAQAHVWTSTGSALSFQSSWYTNLTYTLSQVGDRVVAGDFTGDGKTDLATFYQYSPGAQIHVLSSGGSSFSWAGAWYDSGATAYTLSNVAGRMAAGDFTGGGYDDIAAFYATGADAGRIDVWTSTGSGLGAKGIWFSSSSYTLSVVGDRFVAGDLDDK